MLLGRKSVQRTLNFLMPDQQAPDRNERKNSLLNCGVSTGSLHQINCLVLDALGFFQRVETTCQETELSTTNLTDNPKLIHNNLSPDSPLSFTLRKFPN